MKMKFFSQNRRKTVDDEKRGKKSSEILFEIRADGTFFFAYYLVCYLNEHLFDVNEGNLCERKSQ